MNAPHVSAARAAAMPPAPRRIVHRTRGRRHGPIVRLVSPSDVGALVKPFVFLDYFDVAAAQAPQFGFHPHSGIATLTLLLEGGSAYEDSTGASGTMAAGAVEWMQAGGGVWHTGHAVGARMRGYQLWVALPPALENAPAQSRYLGAERFSAHGRARVILGALGDARSPIDAPSAMNYLDVRLRSGEVWRYDPPAGHDVAWIAVHEGRVLTPEPVSVGELAVFADGPSPIAFRAQNDASFVLGSAARHPHDLVLGDYSVHTDAAALARGEDGIRRIGADLRRSGKV
jgi:redox-sensitive bicupin YhaK (pirin superfamily)